jgi:hypothetical protein
MFKYVNNCCPVKKYFYSAVIYIGHGLPPNFI